MSYQANKEARRAARHSLQTQPLKAGELSYKAVAEPHITPSLLFETLAPRPPSQGSVSNEHLDGGLESRLGALEEQLEHALGRVAELETRLSEAEATIGGLRSDVRTLEIRTE